MGSINSIIKKAPNFIQKAYFNIIPFEKRYGKVFSDTFKFLNESKKWSKDQALNYQQSEFKKLIEHCYRNVPYYTKIFKKNNLTPEDIKDINDITLLPILTKKIIRENIEDLKATNILNQKIYQFKTSGSTGEKLLFYGTDDTYKKEAAFVLRSYQQHRADLYTKPSIWLRRYVPLERNQNLWYYDYELKRLYISSYHINENTIRSYIDKINSINAPTLVGYPSSIYILACLCAKFNLKLKYINKIHVSSEMMLDEWRDKIIEIFNIIPVAHYGAIEKVSFMHQTEDSPIYHENLEYGVNEFISENGYHTIVGTGFLNYYMPFLRYKTEDSVILNKNINNSNFPNTVEKIIGRSSDILIAKDGSRLPGVNFYSWIDKSIYGVQMFQIIQTEIDCIKFNFVRSDKYSDQTLSDIKKGLIARLGDLKIEIEEVPEIKRNVENGKIRCIINNIK